MRTRRYGRSDRSCRGLKTRAGSLDGGLNDVGGDLLLPQQAVERRRAGHTRLDGNSFRLQFDIGAALGWRRTRRLARKHAAASTDKARVMRSNCGSIRTAAVYQLYLANWDSRPPGFAARGSRLAARKMISD